MANEEVLIYTTPDCPYCSKAKSYLTSKSIKYLEYNVANDRARAKEMVDLSGQGGIPVLVIKGRVVVGFRPELIDDALSRPPVPKREATARNIIFDPFDR